MNNSYASLLRTLSLLLALLTAAAPVRANIALLEGGSAYPTLAPLLKEVTPAVVNISVKGSDAAPQNSLARDPFFKHFFNLPDTSRPRPTQAAGSGVIVDAAQGYVLTNHHVVAHAKEITVTLKDRRSFNAKLLGSDAGTDVALLKIEANDLTALKIGNSDDLQVGDFVVAIGNPFGLGQTVTSGIVSALGRSGLNIEGYEDFIQTDASINPGNSGGALVSLKGELIGINTAIIGPAGGNVGIGFAVPSNMAASVLAQLSDYGEVRRGQLGIHIQDLTPALAEALEVDVSHGAVVNNVKPGSTADQAGVQAGDVIVGVNGRDVRGASDLRTQVGLARVGDRLKMRLIRDGRQETVNARIGKLVADSVAGDKSVPQLAGALFQDLAPNTRENAEIIGVHVVEVVQGSPAWRHGLRKGDTITAAVNRKLVGSVSDFTAALEAAPNIVAMDVLRDKQRFLLIIQS